MSPLSKKNSSAPQPRPSLSQISPYIGGKSGNKNTHTVKLSSNENPLGSSPKARDAFKDCAADLHRYPDGHAQALREALANRFSLPVEQLICGAGSDEIISLLTTAFVKEGDEVLYSEHGFLMYSISTLAVGGVPVSVPEKNLKADVHALLEAVTERTKIIFIANPNNPTGTYLTRDEVHFLHSNLPSSVLLVLDAAYSEYILFDPELDPHKGTGQSYALGTELVPHAENVIITRTFSKLFGLAGLRLGWAYSSPWIIDWLNRVRGPFNVSFPAQAAGIAALQDQAHCDQTISLNRRMRALLCEELPKLGYDVTPSLGNFVLFHLKNEKTAQTMLKNLEEQAIFVRGMKGYGLPNSLRVSTGTEQETLLFLETLKTLLQS